MGVPTMRKGADLVLDLDSLEGELERAQAQEWLLRTQLARARYLLALERAVARPAPRVSASEWGVLMFVVASLVSMVLSAWGS
jgi:hypothetical protein